MVLLVGILNVSMSGENLRAIEVDVHKANLNVGNSGLVGGAVGGEQLGLDPKISLRHA